MRLWLVKRITAANWDEYQGFVIQATTEQSAREIANGGRPATAPFDFGADDVWINPDLSTCEELTAAGIAGIILYDFNAG